MHSYPETNHRIQSQPHFFISSISHFMELYIGMTLQIWGKNKFLFRDRVHTMNANQTNPANTNIQ